MGKDTMRRLFDRFSGKKHLKSLPAQPQPATQKGAISDKERELDTLKAALVYEREQYRAAIQALRGITRATLKLAAQQRIQGQSLTQPMANALRELGLEPEEVGAKELPYKPPTYLPDPCEICGQGAKRGKTKCRRCLQGLPVIAPLEKKARQLARERAAGTRCKWCLKPLRDGQCSKHPVQDSLPQGEAVSMADKYRSAVRCSHCHQFTRDEGGRCKGCPSAPPYQRPPDNPLTFGTWGGK